MATFTHCSFAFPGTYGHECGSPAVKVGVRTCKETKDGIYYARRCAVCATHKGGENAGISSFITYDQAVHVNQWR